MSVFPELVLGLWLDNQWVRFIIQSKVSLLLKTQESRKEDLTKLIVESHPYDTPCVIYLPIDGGHAPFMSWVVDQTREKK